MAEKIFSSKSARGFFSSAIHGDRLPADAAPISEEDYKKLLLKQSLGMLIDWSGEEPAAVQFVPTVEAAQGIFSSHVQDYLDGVARQWGYDSAASAVTYAEEAAVPLFQAEGKAIRAWRSRVWAAAASLRDQVVAGSRPAPSPTELPALLPSPPLRPTA